MADKVKKVKSYEAKCPNGGHINKYEICINCKQKETLIVVKGDTGKPAGFKCSNGHAYSDVKCNDCGTKIYWQHFTIDGVPVTPPKPKSYEWVEELFVMVVAALCFLFFFGLC